MSVEEARTAQRERFERWAVDSGWDDVTHWRCEEEYADLELDAAWRAWQAAEAAGRLLHAHDLIDTELERCEIEGCGPDCKWQKSLKRGEASGLREAARIADGQEDYWMTGAISRDKLQAAIRERAKEVEG